MKKGLLIYPNSQNKIFNIGDYIQSIAARQFMGEIDEYIDREKMNDEREDEVALIANGWYMHHPENWPPNNKIRPHFVALHINKLAEKKLFSPESINFFRQHEPIGCRDYYTTKNLQDRGINAYFSGCLTLTLGRTYRHGNNHNKGVVYFTDVNSFVSKTKEFYFKCAKNLIKKIHLIKKIKNRFKEFGYEYSLKWIAAFYTTYSQVISDELFLKAIYIQQEIRVHFSSEEEKFEYANNLLLRYSEASYVITSRIHCALPCLAMGTPVLYVDNLNLGEVHNCRLDGLRELFHTIEIKGDKVSCNLLKHGEKLNGDFSFKNKDAHIQLAENISSSCIRFVEDINKA